MAKIDLCFTASSTVIVRSSAQYTSVIITWPDRKKLLRYLTPAAFFAYGYSKESTFHHIKFDPIYESTQVSASVCFGRPVKKWGTHFLHLFNLLIWGKWVYISGKIMLNHAANSRVFWLVLPSIFFISIRYHYLSQFIVIHLRGRFSVRSL